MHSINVPYQDILPALTISTPYQHTLSAHPTYQPFTFYKKNAPSIILPSQSLACCSLDTASRLR